MKVTKQTATTTKLTSSLDFFGDLDFELPTDAKEELKESLGEFIKEQVLLRVGEVSSPVSGESFPALSSKYKKKKASEGLTPKANLEASGNMLDSLDYRVTKDGIEIGIFGGLAPQADGHNNFSGKSQIPQRRFLPAEGQQFKQDIQREIDRMIRDKYTEQLEVKKQDLSDIGSRSELYDYLEELMPTFTELQIKDAVTRNDELLELLADADLLKYL